MRKTISVLLFSFLAFFLSFTSAKAECSYAKQSELNALASNVKYTIEPKKEEVISPGNGIDPDERFIETTFSLQLFNITEEMNVSVYNDYSNQTKNYSYSDVRDGILEINEGVGNEIVKYKVNIYGVGECGTTLLRTFEVKTPMVNPYKSYGFCEGVTDYYLCQDYLVEDPNMTFYEASMSVKEYLEKKEVKNKEEETNEKNFLQIISSFLKKYGLWIFLVLLIAGIIIVIIIRKNKGRHVI